ncbi:MAG: hypothetical protein L0332_25490 [Chloroflexi bacterium]|nr:hypothetical protein [Chloroflexota bacterium]MCI0730052.1 hypothetical protein [Chloroflexota bacterium]
MNVTLITISLISSALGGILLAWLLPEPPAIDKRRVTLVALLCFVVAAVTTAAAIPRDKSIERLGPDAREYYSNDATADLIHNPGRRYKLDYSITSDPGSYAGFVLVFSEPQDFSEYEYLRLTFIREDNDTKIDFTVRDEAYEAKYCKEEDEVCLDIHTLPLGIDNPDYNQYHWFKSDAKTFVYTIPLDRFTDLNLHEIKQIGFNAQGHLSPGSRTFTIEDITLVADKF